MCISLLSVYRMENLAELFPLKSSAFNFLVVMDTLQVKSAFHARRLVGSEVVT